MRKGQQGFTLVEIVVVIAIIAGLAAIALPSYTEQVRKSRRADAKVALTSLAQAQENFHADYPTYASVLGTSTNVSTNTLGCKTACQIVSGSAYSPEKYYIVKIESYGTGGFLLSATADSSGKQAADSKCKYFVLNASNMKAASTVSVSDAEGKLGQSTADPNNCWG